MTFERRTRRVNWEQELYSFLNRTRSTALEWGQFDCAIGLAAGAVKAQTGVDMAMPHLGKYGDPKEAHRYMRESGWKSLEDLMDAFLTRAKRPHRGNIVLIYGDDWQGFGVRVGRRAMAYVENGGLREHLIPASAPEWSVI